MLAQNLLQFNAQSLVSAGTELKKQETAVKSYSASFKDVFDGAMSKNTTSCTRNIPSKGKNGNEKPAAADNSQKQTVTYREIASKQADKPKAIKTDNSASQKPEVKNDNVKDQVFKNKAVTQEDAVINALAGALGVDPKDMQTLLGFLNIKPEELTDASKSGEIAKKLSALIGLDSDQEKTLSMMIGNAVKKAEKYLAENTAPLPAKNPEAVKDREDWVNTGIKKLELIDNTRIPDDFGKVISAMKARLAELTDKLTQNPSEMMKEVSQSIDEALEKLAAGKQPANDDMVTESSETIVDPEENRKDKLSQKTEEVKPVLRNEEPREAKAESQPQNPLNKVEAVNQQPSVNNLQQPVKADASVRTEASRVEVPVSKEHILSQVVEKAKVVLNGDKSEMMMTLKPESLGKLSLKVVTEHGIIMAKFEAENQQVKQVLETNMQLLKDSLEKQGLAVQGFSVSVNDNRNGSGNQSSYLTEGRAGGRRSGMQNIRVADIIPEISTRNPYDVSENSINLTA